MVGDVVELFSFFFFVKLRGVDAWAGGVLEGEVVSVTPSLPQEPALAAGVESVTCRVKVLMSLLMVCVESGGAGWILLNLGLDESRQTAACLAGASGRRGIAPTRRQASKSLQRPATHRRRSATLAATNRRIGRPCMTQPCMTQPATKLPRLPSASVEVSCPSSRSTRFLSRVISVVCAISRCFILATCCSRRWM